MLAIGSEVSQSMLAIGSEVPQSKWIFMSETQKVPKNKLPFMSEGTSDDMFRHTMIHGTFGLHLPACHGVPQITCTFMAGYLILH